MSAAADRLLPFQTAYELPVRSEAQRWLVTGRWLEQAVGIIDAEPKCCKSFLALDLAVAVASGTPCLRHFPVPTAGRVLLYAAEDALHIVRRRLEGICAAAGLPFQELDVQVITAPTVRLDLPADRTRLDNTAEHLKPTLFVLDPFVRLHRIDENASGEVAPLLAYLRELQRVISSPCSSFTTQRRAATASAAARPYADPPSSMRGVTAISTCVGPETNSYLPSNIEPRLPCHPCSSSSRNAVSPWRCNCV